MRTAVPAVLALVLASGCASRSDPKHAEPAQGDPTLYNEGGATKDQKERAQLAIDGATDAQVRITTAIAQALRVMVAMWLTAYDTCPTPDQIMSMAKDSTTLRATDMWENPYKITCTDTGPVVRSAGPDGVMGTKDDIVVPDTAR